MENKMEILNKKTKEVIVAINGYDLVRADLCGTYFNNANLSRADLTGARIKDADFEGARLIGISFDADGPSSHTILSALPK